MLAHFMKSAGVCKLQKAMCFGKALQMLYLFYHK